jgi:hypothetical protein
MRRRRSKPQQLLKIIESLEPNVAPKIRGVIDSLEPEVASRLANKGIRRATYAAGGLALLTAASASVSSLRSRLES